MKMGNIIIVFGIILLIIGVMVNLLGRFGIPKLPGDILIQRDGFTFYFPIVISIILSILLTVIFHLLGRR
ncbi:DUF2905 domain-containing protein [Candidatus Roizmanbacteria bacterium]|nr:DUF2905 domain-containing protein [Candidatus Roizmanbacteria bacterium]